MFVFLKVLLFLLRPTVWIVVLFMGAAVSKVPRRRSIMFKIALAFLLLFSNPFIIRTLITAYETPPWKLSTGQSYEAGILLGGLVSYNKEENEGYFNGASDRFIQTALLYKKAHIKKIIVAAGNGYIVEHDFREAQFIRNQLMALGVPGEDILAESDSKNTIENAANSLRVADSAQLRGPFLLISSAMHLPRAKLAFEKQGLKVVPYPCDFDSRNVGNNILEDYVLPSAMAMNKWDNLIKELAGTVVYHLRY